MKRHLLLAIASGLFFPASINALPITTILSDEDLNDPQPGYLHAASGIENGNFAFGKKGNSAQNLRRVGLGKFYFGSRATEVIEGFTPKHGYCRYITNKWSCLIFSSYEDVISHQRSSPLLRSKTHVTDVLICNDCRPMSTPGWVRTCPGYYQDLFTGNEQIDQLMPSHPKVFTKEGVCIYKKPWFKTLSKNEIELHLKKELQP
jgi:hypothetical protein